LLITHEGGGLQIFIGGGVKSAGSRAYLENVALVLEEAGHQVFLPHRDGTLPGKTGNEQGLLTGADILGLGRWVFEGNLECIRGCGAVVAVLDGLCWGTTMELGYAYAYKMLVKPDLIIIGIYTDPVDVLDIMRFYACDEVLASLEALPTALTRLATHLRGH